MGRKRLQKQPQRSQEELDNNYYFGEAEEQAFREYADENTSENRKDELFHTILYPAFSKIVECQIRGYRLFVINEDYETTFNNAMSFIISKLDYFDPEKNTKAFSYFGTICKRHLIAERKRSMKTASDSVSYDTAVNEYGIENIPDTDNTEADIFVRGLVKEFMRWMERILRNENPYDVLTDGEVKVGKALMSIFEDPDRFNEITECMGGSLASRSSKRKQKFNRTNIIYYIQEITMLPIAEVKAAIKRFKDLYIYVKGYYKSKPHEE